MLNGKTIHQVSTKKDQDGDAVNTTLTLDWTDVSDELVKAIATRQIIVTRQGAWRRADGGIPTTDVFKVAEYGTRTPEPVTVETTLARGLALSEDEQKKLIEQLTANLKAASGKGAPAGKGNNAK